MSIEAKALSALDADNRRKQRIRDIEAELKFTEDYWQRKQLLQERDQLIEELDSTHSLPRRRR